MSSSGSSLIVGCLSHTQQRELADSFSKDLTKPENIGGLSSVLDSLSDNDEVLETVSNRLTDSFTSALTTQTELSSLEDRIKLLIKLPRATSHTLDWVYNTIVSEIHLRKAHILTPTASTLFDETFTSSENPGSNSDISLQYLLSFLEKLFSSESIIVSESLDKLMLLLLSCTDDKIISAATKVLRWRDVSAEALHAFTWKMIFLLSRSEETAHVTAGFILWLRFLIGTSKKNITCTEFTSAAQDEEYWTFIQNGLTSSTHEHRKYCLSILKLTLQQLTVDVDNSLITFTMSQKSTQIEEWKRFATLYEIIGVDTALNQAIAAHNDLVQLLSPSSFIKPSWGMALLCTGFKGNMEAVRKYSLELMFSVPKENLSNFAHPFLTDIFLKYALEGSHFQVKKQGDDYSCVYGERLELFVSSLIKSLAKNESKFESTVTSLIDLLVEITPWYAPSRIYLTSGLLKGLKGKQILTKKHVLQVYRLFESTAEDDVFATTLQTLHIRLLRHIKQDVPLLVEALTRFVQFNGYEIFQNNVETFLDYISAYHDGSEISYQGREPEFQVVCYALFDKYTTSNEFLTELAFSGLDVDAKISMDYSSLLAILLKGEYESYEKCKYLTELSVFKNSWRAVNLQTLYESVIQMMDLDKLEFFSSCFSKVSDVSDIAFFQFEELTLLHNTINAHIISSNFKIKDSYCGAFLTVLHSFLRMTPLTPSQLTEVLTILQLELKNGNYHGFTHSSLIIQYLLRNYEDIDLITIVEILESIWDHITGDRLILSQREMHMIVIETIFDERLLRDTINNEYNGKTLLKIGLEVVELAQTRRCLLPCLSRKLLQYQRAYGVEFEQTTWLVDVLIAIITLIQEDSNMFTIKNVIAEKFDTELSFDGEIYQKVYGSSEVSAKVNAIAILTGCSVDFSEEYFRAVMSNKYTFVAPKKKNDGVEELQRVFAFASLLLICRKISSEMLSGVALQFSKLLEKESSPWVRAYMEWIVSIDLIRNKESRPGVFALCKDQGKPVLVTSAERISYLVAQKLEGDEALEFFDSFTKHLIPNCASNKPLVRHFSNSLILSLYPLLQSKKIDLPVDGILKMLYDEAEKSAVTGKYRTGDAVLWDVEEDFNLVAIFGGVLSRISPRQFEVITEKEFRDCIGDEMMPISIGSTKLASWAGATSDTVGEANTNDADTESSPLQTKSGAWESVLDIDENVRNVKRTELIVVSSLVDKPPNLGGICRLCDVLGAGLMTVDDLRVKKHPQFKNVAVTADYWMPMEEVNIANIADFMRSKKKEGYTLIGLEQTDKSIVLGKDTTFPSKSLFLLGKEAEGIPGELLSELDYCVEIRQLGVIRSMNIQTATAVLVHAYSSQAEV
ncbi:putative methyltransferase TARBP1 [Cyberlindnera fabianii]|uniref:Putative methyltransferase TARBP1 n=1 Tax=Cyberlindnera fabianii TaxID=36022 RepID=A0A1V2L8C6_CYBFA|nr:putative methyltransferase TARBP1 [Cyberlindnera fabianii]